MSEVKTDQQSGGYKMITLHITFTNGKDEFITVNKFKLTYRHPMSKIPDILIIWDSMGQNAYKMEDIALIEFE